MTQARTEDTERANVEALKPVYEAWGRGDFSPRFEIYAPEMEWGWSGEFPGLEGVSPDPELRSPRLQSWLSGWENWRCEAEEMIPSGRHVVALCRYTGRGRESGVEVDTRGAHLWTMDQAKVIRLEVFSSREKALRAAGLGPAAERPPSG